MRVAGLTLLLFSLCSAQEPDWPAVKAEAVQTLVDLVRLDTSQPEGNEILAARYLADRLKADGIDSVIVGPSEKRASIVARLKGSGAKRPLLLLGHTDVVTVDPSEWSFDAFGGAIKDGILYGRGAGDDKSVVAAELTVLLQLARLGVKLDRDVIFLGVADEEAGGLSGITWMLENKRDLIDAEYAINEGGGGVFERGFRFTSFEVGTAEKTPRRMDLRAKGTSGHGSVPKKDNPVVTLSRALAKLSAYETPVELNETTRTYFERLAGVAPPSEAAVYRRLLDGDVSEELQEDLRAINPYYYSMIRTSIVPTIVRGGYQKNVIPADAEATVDIRALPGEDPEEFFSRLKAVMDEPLVDLVPHPVTRPAHPPSPLSSPVFQAFEKVLGERHPGVVVLPRMSTGASDSAQLRAAGIPSYGFGPAKGAWDPGGGIHGKDEYLYVEAFEDYVQTLYGVVVEVAASGR
ncbi:MAG: M20/M25/M40 family metallo-hydrolase [Acidobacteria bacterium]|nr:M20/M25/M40 family metallo-hydrolase [Acidobacteriota bacterium]